MTDAVRDKRIFDVIRDILGRGLTQPEVGRVNAAIYGEKPEKTKGGLMRVGPAGIALMHKWEKCVLKAYPDPASGGKPWTIGWGSITDEKGSPIQPGAIWSKERADQRFYQYIAEMEKGMNQLIGDCPTSQNQFDAMASFAYNLGLDIDADTIAEGLGDSTLLKKHLRGDFAGAKAEFVKWNKGAGKVMKGLTNRRLEEAALYAKP